MAISAQVPFVSVRVWPIDPEANNRTQWTLSENYAGCFQAGSDGGTEDGEGIPGFKSVQFSGQSTFNNLQGPIDFVRFTTSGRVERGASAALQSNPSNELCGITVQLRRQVLHNKMEHEPQASKGPDVPVTSPLLLWVPEAGQWETVANARTPIATSIQPYAISPNKAFKVKTQTPWDADRGFIVLWDHDGVPYGHESEPAVRLSWGDKWSLVFRGLGDKERPSLERRESGEWRCVRILRDCAPLDQTFWTSSHTVRVQRIGGRMCINVDGVEYGISEIKQQGQTRRNVQVSWPQKPLRVSLWGAHVMFRVHSLTGDSAEPAKDGSARPLQVSFNRVVPAPGHPPFEQGSLEFQATGSTPYRHDVPVEGDTAESPRGSIGIKAQLLGESLGKVSVVGSWEKESATYAAVLQCTSTAAPLLSSLVAQFVPLPTSSAPEPIEIRPVITSLSVDSGDPESLPDSEAELTLSFPLLDQLVPEWRKVILPYRPIHIRARYSDHDDEPWKTLFRGYLTPENRSRDTWNDQEVPLIARGPLVRLSEPAALVDERFGPLDLQLSAGKTSLWGAEAVKNLLTVELGQAWTAKFNGNGDPFRYLPEGHYPLLDSEGGGYFDAIQAPLSGNWRFPPPFGDYLKSWIDSLAKFDYAAWFFDADEDAFFYGRIIELFIERGKVPRLVPETAPPTSVTTTRDWPVLSSLQQSGLLEHAFNDVRVWGASPQGGEGLTPSFIMGRAGDSDPRSIDPTSIVQSWRRTQLIKPDFVKEGVVDNEFANALAYSIWQEHKGRPPVRMEAEFATGFLGPRWGEILRFPTGFTGPQNKGQQEDWRILRVKHTFNFSGSQDHFTTNITTRSLSASGQ